MFFRGHEPNIQLRTKCVKEKLGYVTRGLPGIPRQAGFIGLTRNDNVKARLPPTAPGCRWENREETIGA